MPGPQMSVVILQKVLVLLQSKKIDLVLKYEFVRSVQSATSRCNELLLSELDDS